METYIILCSLHARPELLSFKQLPISVLAGGWLRHLGHTNSRACLPGKRRKGTQLVAGLFLEIGVWASEDMRVGDAFLGSRTWEMGKRGVWCWRITVRGVCFFFKTFPPYFSSAFNLFMHYVGLCWVFIAACRLLLVAARGALSGCFARAPLRWLPLLRSTGPAGPCGRNVSVAAAPRI